MYQEEELENLCNRIKSHGTSSHSSRSVYDFIILTQKQSCGWKSWRVVLCWSNVKIVEKFNQSDIIWLMSVNFCSPHIVDSYQPATLCRHKIQNSSLKRHQPCICGWEKFLHYLNEMQNLWVWENECSISLQLSTRIWNNKHFYESPDSYRSR